MAKKKMSFMDALLGSFKPSTASKKSDIASDTLTEDDEFYNEEGKFDKFTEVKEPKKKYVKLKNSKNNEFEEVEKPKKKKSKKSDSEFDSEGEVSYTDNSDFGPEIDAIDDDTLL